jgi:AraC-like DNA-binding protein
VISLLDAGFRFGAIALLGLIALRIFQQRVAIMPALVAVAFTITLSAYLMCSAYFWNDLPRWLHALLLVGCLANPLLFWLLSRSIFEDGFRLTWSHALLFVAIEAVGFWYLFGLHTLEFSATSQSLIAKSIGGLLQASGIAFVFAALITAYRGRAPDLIESRRDFRIRFVTIAGGYMVFVIIVEVFLRGTSPHPVASVLHAAAIFAIVFYFANALFALKINLLFEPVQIALPAMELDVAERMLLEKLDAAIANRSFLQDGLTIGQLASQLGAQEHRLRRLINAKMGFRNFNDFLNHHRIRVACQQLGDPALARIPVLTIAMKLGYGSIGPFNRAFKQSTGLTPTEFRRQKLAGLDLPADTVGNAE